MRLLNGFVLIGIILLFISFAGLVKGNTLLTEPGQPANPYAWLLYLGAAGIMLVNGAVSIWSWKQHEQARAKQAVAETPDEAQSEEHKSAE